MRGSFFGRIDVFVPVPEPLVWPLGKRPEIGRQQIADKDGLVEPGGENPIQHHALELRLLDADRLEISLMVEAAGGVVVAGGICRRDVEGRSRHAQSAYN